jgi:hypothetical protein
MRFMQNTFDWILAPTEIKVYASKDGKEWTLVADKHFDMDPRETGMRLKNYTVPLNFQFSTFNFQFLRVVVPTPVRSPRGTPPPASPPTSSPTKLWSISQNWKSISYKPKNRLNPQGMRRLTF